MDFRFDDILPYLASAYRRGVLVPFIGSGMSVPTCTGWKAFILRLADEAGIAVSANLKNGQRKTLDSAELYRLADRAVRGLGTLSATARANAYRRALIPSGKAPGSCDIPEQTRTLARRHWPLVLSTNYDDLYPVSRWRQSSGGETAAAEAPEVLGRDVEDCHKVVRSLDRPSRPILWALQGFLGGQAALQDKLVSDRRRRLVLEGQVVAGHQQYQNVINSQIHFRRAFAEVFHRRSLLFLGSGILEDYFVNLFGEISHHYGPSPHPHFALFPRMAKKTLDSQFLRTRLGITPVFYDDYGVLPELLDRLANCLSGSGDPPHAGAPATPVAWMHDELGFSLSNGSRPPFGSARKVRLRYAPLPVPARDGSECAIVSVGRTVSNRPLEGGQARTLLAEMGLKVGARGRGWKALDKAPSLVFRFGDEPLFGIAARLRNTTGRTADHRDLGIISESVGAALRAASRAGFRRVHLGPVASGRYRLWHPFHPFVQTLTGVREFFASNPDTRIDTLELHVMHPAVWSPVLAGRIPVAELLSSNVTKIWVDIRDPEGRSEILGVITRGSTKLGDIKKLCGLVPDRWSADILPRPSRLPPAVQNPDDLLVAPTSLVVFTPRE
ncbi:SIR2 family protein [Hyalangium sp.]|uniref:SIR2 family NAD-dependent protein deacylase n=1 Tax=Hyalangium sp. TaxID=2028555 RepID=UPI002D7329A7|nr:SIR2 family protein [Hyalangium sp.]HYH94706.1 SIR2 family protein [Hyalangium sp.]